MPGALEENCECCENCECLRSPGPGLKAVSLSWWRSAPLLVLSVHVCCRAWGSVQLSTGAQTRYSWSLKILTNQHFECLVLISSAGCSLFIPVAFPLCWTEQWTVPTCWYGVTGPEQTGAAAWHRDARVRVNDLELPARLASLSSAVTSVAPCSSRAAFYTGGRAAFHCSLCCPHKAHSDPRSPPPNISWDTPARATLTAAQVTSLGASTGSQTPDIAISHFQDDTR